MNPSPDGKMPQNFRRILIGKATGAIAVVQDFMEEVAQWATPSEVLELAICVPLPPVTIMEVSDLYDPVLVPGHDDVSNDSQSTSGITEHGDEDHAMSDYTSEPSTHALPQEQQQQQIPCCRFSDMEGLLDPETITSVLLGTEVTTHAISALVTSLRAHKVGLHKYRRHLGRTIKRQRQDAYVRSRHRRTLLTIEARASARPLGPSPLREMTTSESLQDEPTTTMDWATHEEEEEEEVEMDYSVW